MLAAIDRFSPSAGMALPRSHGAQHALDMVVDLAGQMSRVEHRRKTLVCIGSAAAFNMSEQEFGKESTSIPAFTFARDAGEDNRGT